MGISRSVARTRDYQEAHLAARNRESYISLAQHVARRRALTMRPSPDRVGGCGPSEARAGMADKRSNHERRHKADRRGKGPRRPYAGPERRRTKDRRSGVDYRKFPTGHRGADRRASADRRQGEDRRKAQIDYAGPERRSGKDRRTGGDRRKFAY